MHHDLQHHNSKECIENSYTAKLKKRKGFILIKSFSDGLPVENWQLQHQILGPQQQLSQTFVWRNSWKYFMLWQEYWILRTHYFLLHQDLLFCQQNIDSALRFSIRIVTYLITTLFRPVKSTPKSAYNCVKMAKMDQNRQ